ncbi:GspE/PulE family protein [Spirochaeta africana]|uniref:Type II secretory pathway, ATPase PulE/Tfp pilus assembly pathway, ATPase PilB n=1 Tax=Spirochaeta africana (strain ATCC 700263 / DSM 8902 / Z-7692) TaxID=889378 RepID=H9UK46_SPIAZ|nr:GspE/PulE family protein [Spirochaeta africana]AFG37889.1 type II secretory pathway, ATPase PulE/Tfp pilus assembly pathway, ATPase PilB [Spirochaeta africana DSM 8902]
MSRQVLIQDYLPLPSSQYPERFVIHNGAIKLQDDVRGVTIGLTNPQDSELRCRLENYHAAVPHSPPRIHFAGIDAAELTAYLGSRCPEYLNSPGDDDPGNDADLLDRLANDAPIVNLVNSILIEGIRRSASDIHIEAGREEATVRLRIDGILMRERMVPQRLFPGVSSRIKVMAGLNLMERRLPQDGRCRVSIQGNDLDIRVSTLPTIHGESLVLRLLQHTGHQLKLDELGFSADQTAGLRQSAAVSHGLIAVTGPTGSGKSTTLHALLAELADGTRKIITIEDPVEYRTAGVEQIQTNEHIGLGFDTVLRRILRQDPDIIMVGEIRDSSTAELAVRAALTGHLVLTTLHTNDAAAAVVRLTDLGVPPFLTAAVLRSVAAQRLVRKLCPSCRQPAPVSASQHHLLQQLCRKTGQDIPDMTYTAPGCRCCRGSGFRGRTALTELLVVDHSTEAWILQGLSPAAIRVQQRHHRHRTLQHSGVTAITNGTAQLSDIYSAVAPL